jgi:hypothetical protein
MATNSIASSQVCRLQKSILDALSGLPGHFYLSDSSALCRFYLNHRITEELVFILDSGADFHGSIKLFTSRLANYFTLQQVFTSDSAAVVIASADNINIHIRFQQALETRISAPIISNMIHIDDLINIFIRLVINLSCEKSPETLLDIIKISCQYQYNWQMIINKTNTITPISIQQLIENLSNISGHEIMNIDGQKHQNSADELEVMTAKLINDIKSGNDNSLCPLGAELINAIIDQQRLSAEEL